MAEDEYVELLPIEGLEPGWRLKLWSDDGNNLDILEEQVLPERVNRKDANRILGRGDRLTLTPEQLKWLKEKLVEYLAKYDHAPDERESLKKEVKRLEDRSKELYHLAYYVGKHIECGGNVIIADPGSGAIICEKCQVQDWGDWCGPYDEHLYEHTESEDSLRKERDALKAKLKELGHE